MSAVVATRAPSAGRVTRRKGVDDLVKSASCLDEIRDLRRPPLASAVHSRLGETLAPGSDRAVWEQTAVPIEFVARSHLPMLGYDEQLEVMQQLAEGVAPHV